MFSKAKPCKSGSCFKVQIFLFWFKAAFLDTLQAGLACWRRDTWHGVADTYLGEIKKLFVSVMQNSQSYSMQFGYWREIIRIDWNKPYTIFAVISENVLYSTTHVFKFFSRLKQWAAPLRTFGEISVQPHSNLILFHMNGVETTMHNKCSLTGRF